MKELVLIYNHSSQKNHTTFTASSLSFWNNQNWTLPGSGFFPSWKNQNWQPSDAEILQKPELNITNKIKIPTRHCCLPAVHNPTLVVINVVKPVIRCHFLCLQQNCTNSNFDSLESTKIQVCTWHGGSRFCAAFCGWSVIPNIGADFHSKPRCKGFPSSSWHSRLHATREWDCWFSTIWLRVVIDSMPINGLARQAKPSVRFHFAKLFASRCGNLQKTTSPTGTKSTSNTFP